MTYLTPKFGVWTPGWYRTDPAMLAKPGARQTKMGYVLVNPEGRVFSQAYVTEKGALKALPRKLAGALSQILQAQRHRKSFKELIFFLQDTAGPVTSIHFNSYSMSFFLNAVNQVNFTKTPWGNNQARFITEGGTFRHVFDNPTKIKSITKKAVTFEDGYKLKWDATPDLLCPSLTCYYYKQ